MSISRRNFIGLGLAAWAIFSGCTPKKAGQSSMAPTTAAGSSKPNYPSEPLPDGLLNILVIGSDTRDGDVKKGNSDVICLVQLSADRKHLNMISVARDTAVPVTAPTAKINSFYPNSGKDALITQLKELYGDIKIDYTLEIGFDGFTKVIDTLGGIMVMNKHASYVEDTAFDKGKISLVGKTALYFVRQRKDLPNGDLDRTERHRAALTGIMEKIGALASENEAKAVEIVSKAWALIQPTGVTLGQACSLLQQVKSLTAADVTSVLMPISRFDNDAALGSIDILDKARAQELADGIKKGDLVSYVGKYGTDVAPTNG